MTEEPTYRKRYEELFQFFGGYFNQFWKTTTPFDAPPSDRGVVAYAAKSSLPQELREVQAQLRAFLAEPLDDAMLGDILLHDFGCSYNPRAPWP